MLAAVQMKKTQALRALTCKWPAIMLRLMSNKKRMLRARCHGGLESRARFRQQRRDRLTFSSGFLVGNVRRRSRRRHRFVVAFNNQCRSNERMNILCVAAHPLAITQSFKIYVRQSEENFGSWVTQDRQQTRSQCGEARASRGAAREWTARRI